MKTGRNGEPLDQVAKTMVTQTTSQKIDSETKPGRGRSDVIRDAIDFYFDNPKRKKKK